MSTDELRSALQDIRQTLGVVITALEGLSRRFDRLEADRCDECRERRRSPTGPALPALFKEGCGNG